MNRFIERIDIRKIYVWAIMSRFVMLLCVTTFSTYLTEGLLGSDEVIQDDLRYIKTATIYADIASEIIDPKAIDSALDITESGSLYNHKPELWYWMVSVFMYLLGNVFLVKLINIIFAVITIRCIYDICRYLYDTRTAKIAALVYAVLPYPVMFCCFLYKDQFFTMLAMLLIRKAIQCAKRIRLNDYLYMIVGLVLIEMTRGGFSALFLAAIMIIIYKRGNYKLNRITLFAIILSFICVLCFVVYLLWETVLPKVYAYLLSESEQNNSTINMVEIKSPLHLYRYPLAFLFALVQPLNLTLQLETWMDFAGIINFLNVPIAIGAFYYFINIKMKKDYFFWILQGFYLITILASLGIVRHQYYLQPFLMIFFANYLIRKKNVQCLRISTFVVIFFVIAMWVF